MLRILLLTPFFLLAAQPPAVIHIQAGVPGAPFKPIYNWFGYDEPNYTYGAHGPKLLHELASLAPVPVYIRTHNLLTTGNGEASLKWGSTNVYTEDAQGHPVYDWKILDRILDTYRDARTRPMFEIGFMPEALSTNPKPYRHNWPQTGITAGWSYPPKDYGKWEELNYQIVRHCVERYGKENVEKWLWEVWNEPDIGYWKGTPEEYFQLYTSSVKGVRRALATAKIGGPATTGPANPKAAAFLKFFLDRCAETNVPLDFISYHAKGRPSLVDGHVRMGLEKELADVEAGLEIIAAYPEFRDLPIILSEADPEGCAACSARNHAENAYRNGPLYATYTAAALKGIQQLAEQHHMNIAGMLTWAFEFEDQPYFEGFRTLATNGIDKPVLNVFRMFGQLSGQLLPTTVAPAPTTTPISASTPAATATPVSTSTPAATTAPVSTSTPATTPAPVSTSTPATTPTPVSTSTPPTTTTPVSASTPATTTTPIPSRDRQEAVPQPTPLQNRDRKEAANTPNLLATRTANTVTILLWNYHPDDIPGPATEVTLDITGLPPHLHVQHYRIDEHHSNAYTMWKQMGSPQQPSPDQKEKLESAAQLQLLTPAERRSSLKGRLQLNLHLPYQSVDLITLTGGPQ